jgi:hypothetical protein
MTTATASATRRNAPAATTSLAATIIIVLLMLAIPLRAQTIGAIPFDTLCSNIGYKVGDPIFIPANFTAEMLANSVQSYLSPIATLMSTVVPEWAEPFYVGAYNGVCLTFFRMPDPEAAKAGVALPINMCRSACEQFLADVTPFLIGTFGSIEYAGRGLFYEDLPANTLPINCSGWETAYPELQPYFAPYNFSGFEVGCSPYEPNLAQYAGCVAPFVPVNSFACGWEAPFLPITRDQYETIRDVSFGLGLVGLLFAIVFFVVSPVYRSWWGFPGYLIPLACLYSAVGHVSFMGTKMLGIDAMWADGGTVFRFANNPVQSGTNVDNTPVFYFDTTGFTTSSGLCSVQGFGIYVAVFGVVVIILQAMLAITIMLYKAQLDDFLKRWLRISRPWIVYHLMDLWHAFPLVGAISLAASGNIIFAPGSGYCGIDPRDIDMLVPFVVLPLVAISAAAFAVLLLNATVIVYKVCVYGMAKTRDGISASLLVVRIAVIAALGLISALAVSISLLYIAATSDQANRDSSDYINCSFNLLRASTCDLSPRVYIAQMVSVVFLLVLLLIFPMVGVVVVTLNARQLWQRVRRFPWTHTHIRDSNQMTVTMPGDDEEDGSRSRSVDEEDADGSSSSGSGSDDIGEGMEMRSVSAAVRFDTESSDPIATVATNTKGVVI